MLRVRTPLGLAAERRYVLDVMLGEFLGLRYELVQEERADVVVSAGGDSRLVLPDTFFGCAQRRWLERTTLPSAPFAVADLSSLPLPVRLVERSLPVVFGGPLENGSYFEISERTCRLGLDPFGTAFVLLTRYEELVQQERDEHDRFPCSASFLHRMDACQRPVVNEYLELLWAALSHLFPQLRRKSRQYRLVLSHDVDRPFVPRQSLSRFVGSCGADVLVRRNPSLMIRRVAARVLGRTRARSFDPYNTLGFIGGQSERIGLRSAFYFIARSGRRTVDADYELDDPEICELMRQTHVRGHEVGIHLSYDTYRDPERTRQEVDRFKAVTDRLGIRQERWGGRQHYLRFETPTTWQNWTDAGLDYDSTMTFHDHVGFRCGVCYEYPVFNLRTRRALPLRERPLAVMDVTCFRYMKLGAEELLHVLERLSRACRTVDGEMGVLWHNTNLISRRQRALYRKALEVLR